jgi:uncharacterized protein
VPEPAEISASPARAYFDSSAIAKQFLHEQGSERARALYGGHRVVSSLLAPLEAAAAFHRRLANREMTQSEYEGMLRRLADDRSAWDLVSLEEDVLRRAEGLVRRSAIRALDAIHVASAMFVTEAAGISLSFITADGRQRQAAEASGLEVIWVA